MVAPPPHGVVPAGPGRFTYEFRSKQAYFGAAFGVMGIIIPIIMLSQAFRNGVNIGMLVFPVIFVLVAIGVCGYLCSKFPWTKCIFDFNAGQITYCMAPLPMILWTQPNKTAPIQQLGNISIEETGITSGSGRRGRGGAPIFAIKCGLAQGESITLATVAGHYNVSPLMSAWTLWLTDMGINVNSNAMHNPQLMAIMPMNQQPMMMQPGSPQMMMAGSQGPGVMMGQPPPPNPYYNQQQQPPPPQMGYGDNIPPPPNNGYGYGGPPPPPPPPASPPGFTDYNNLDGSGNTAGASNNQHFTISTQPPPQPNAAY